MIFLEAGLLAIIVSLFVSASISDFKSGKITNRSILIALGAGVLCAVPYYAFFATDCLLSYTINNALTLVIGLLLYATGIWGAGDSKLLFVTTLLFPARLYCLGNSSLASCFLLVSLVFIIAFLYIVGDTIYMGIRQRNLFRIQKRKMNWKNYAKGFLFFFLMLSLMDAIIFKLLPVSLLYDSFIITAIHFILILVGMRIENKANWIVVAVMGVAWILMIVFGLTKISLSNINWWSYLVVLALMVFRLFADKYNYKIIPLSELKPGMILAFVSIIAFMGSKIEGLPTSTTEDLKSRLSVEEVESIKKWAESSDGIETITIVRKIPFALFIAIGTIVFTILEVLTA